MYCIKCGSETVEEAEFCAQCGTKITKEEKLNRTLVEPIVEKPKTNKSINKTKGLLIILLLISFAVFSFGVVNLFDLYDYYLFRTTYIDESIQIIDNNIAMQSNESGIAIQGNIQSPDGTFTYDTVYDDDTTNDGYKDRRSYYIASDLIFASWDKNRDGIYELSMKVSEGIYVDTSYADLNHDGNIDEIVQYDQVGEPISVDTPEMIENKIANSQIQFIEVIKIQDILLIVIPIILVLFISILLWKASKKSRVGKKFICFLLMMSLLSMTNMSVVYSSEGSLSTNNIDLYNEDGTINQLVFERDWMKYSDIDERIPIETRSYEARSYAQTEKKVVNIYNQMYDFVRKQELNRIEYVELTNYKKSIVYTQTRNLIKSFFRLAAFTAYTIKDAADTGRSFAEDTLKSSATVLSRLGNVLDVTSNYSTEDYQDDFSNVNTALTYGISDSILDTLKDDVKGHVKEEVEEILDSENLYATVDDLKLSDDDIALLKKHHQKNRDLDNSILENRNISKEFDAELKELNNQIVEEIANMKEFKQQEKERVYYLLTQNLSNDEEETIDGDEDNDWVLLDEYVDDDWVLLDEYVDDDWFLPEEEGNEDEYQLPEELTDRFQEVTGITSLEGMGYTSRQEKFDYDSINYSSYIFQYNKSWEPAPFDASIRMEIYRIYTDQINFYEHSKVNDSLRMKEALKKEPQQMDQPNFKWIEHSVSELEGVRAYSYIDYFYNYPSSDSELDEYDAKLGEDDRIAEGLYIIFTEPFIIDINISGVPSEEYEAIKNALFDYANEMLEY